MNRAGPSTHLRSTTEELPWEEVRRLYRRTCLLRARGHDEAADALEHSELARALARAVAPPIDEDRLLAEESERVTQASLLADLIAPLVADRLHAAPATLSASALSPASATVPAAVAPASTPRRSQEAAVPSIADLIDGMLAQDRARVSPAHP